MLARVSLSGADADLGGLATGVTSAGGAGTEPGVGLAAPGLDGPVLGVSGATGAGACMGDGLGFEAKTGAGTGVVLAAGQLGFGRGGAEAGILLRSQ